ncbi:MAG: cytochrome P450 [Acidobacteriota bacterium]|nr:cytochrome P450 [Acidobacteriota bacterium]
MSAYPYNLFAPEAIQNPYPVYARMRREAPVVFDPNFHAWLLTRHEDVSHILLHAATNTVPPPLDLPPGMPEHLVQMQAEIAESMKYWLALTDPPEHTRLRRFMNKAFKPALVHAMRPRIQEICDHLIDNMRGKDEIELIGDLAFPLPAMVIADMLGFPKEDRLKLAAWADHMVDYFADYTYSQVHLIENMHRTIVEMKRAVMDLVRLRRQEPREDLISHMLTPDEAGLNINEEAMVSISILLLFAGHETSMNMIGNGVLALLHNPDQYDLLKREPGILESAVKEILRYDSPVQYTARNLSETTTIGDVTLEAGSRLFLMLGAANRDPEVFTDPDRLDLGRAVNPHLALGQGKHFCLGAPLAQLEGEIAFSTFCRRVHDVEKVTKTESWRPSPNLRGLKTLRLRYSRITD